MSTITRNFTETEQVVYAMLTESTGRHMLDSGGAYGRHWERNQRRTIEDFERDQPTTLESRYGIEITHNLFHWLPERLDYEAEVDAVFEKWAMTGDRENEAWLPLAQIFAEDVLDGTGIYGDGRPAVVNTYNGEDLLSQTIQYVYFEFDEPAYIEQGEDGNIELVVEDHADDEGIVTLDADAYVLLQIHNGCDVRGGYTRPRLFRVMEELAIMENAEATVFCDGCNARWRTDDGYSFFGIDREEDFSSFPHIEGQDSRGWAHAALIRVLYEAGEDLEDWGLEPTLVSEDNKLYCPYSGHELGASDY